MWVSNALGGESLGSMILPSVLILRNCALRIAFVLCLLIVWATQLSGQCPPRPRIPDPPGWAIDTMGGGIYGYQLSADGNWFGFNSDGGIWLMSVRTGDRKLLLPCIEVSADAIAFSLDSSLMALGTGNGVIYLFEVPSGVLKAELHDEDWVQKLRFGPSDLLIATRSDGLSIWSTTASQRVAFLSGGTCADGGPCVWQYLDEAELSPDGKLIATSGRENSGILVRDMGGKVRLWIKEPKEMGTYLFLPGVPNMLVVSTSTEFDFWDIGKKQIVRRMPHKGFVALYSVLPGSLTTVVSALRLSDESEDIQRVDITSGKVLSSWHSTHYLSWVSPDGIWATTYDRKVLYMPTQQVTAKLERVSSIAPGLVWKVDYSYLAARILRKEAPVYLVVLLFVLLGVFGYLLCHASKYAFVPCLASAFTLSYWWLQELWWPPHGPPIGRALGLTSVGSTVVAMAVACLLPVGAMMRGGLNWRSSSKMRLAFRWGLPLISACLAGSLLAVSIAQSHVAKERYQVEGDIRAGGELRGSGMVPWFERNLPYEAASAINGPSLLLANFLPESGEHLVPLGAATGAFVLWSLVAAVLFPPFQEERRSRLMFSAGLAIIQFCSAAMLLAFYTLNRIYRAYTPTSRLFHSLLWSCCLGAIAMFVFIDIRRKKQDRSDTHAS